MAKRVTDLLSEFRFKGKSAKVLVRSVSYYLMPVNQRVVDKRKPRLCNSSLNI